MTSAKPTFGLRVAHGLGNQGDDVINQYLLLRCISGEILDFIVCVELEISAGVAPFSSSSGYD